MLAVSEDAADVIATPYQVENPTGTAARSSIDVLGVREAELLETLSDRDVRLRLPGPQGGPATTRPRVEDLEHPRDRDRCPTAAALYPQGELASQVIGAVGTENEGLTGLEQAEDDVLGGANGEQEVVHDALGEPIRLETVTPGERRRGHPAHARRRDPGQDRGGARGGGRALRRRRARPRS